VEARAVGQLHLDVAEAAAEAGGGAERPAVDREPDAVQQLERRRPEAAHLAADVKAHGRPLTVLGSHRVGAGADRGVAAIVEAVGGRQLRGGSRRGRSTAQRESEAEAELAEHPPEGLPGPGCG
jgi:hypothetical protein